MIPYISIMNKRIPMYGLCIVIGILVSSLFVIFRCKKKKLCWENVVIIGATGIGIGLISAKVFYLCISFTPSEFIKMMQTKNFSAIMDGGFVFYGGLAGGIFGALLGAKFAKTNLAIYEDCFAMAIPLAHFWGRLGCLCAGCCYGIPCKASIGIVYTNPIGDTPVGVPLLPIQLYESIYNLIVFLILFVIDKKIKKTQMLFAFYLLFYAAGRFVLEFFRYDYARGVYFGMSTSQYISVLIIIIAFLLLAFYKKRVSPQTVKENA